MTIEAVLTTVETLAPALEALADDVMIPVVDFVRDALNHKDPVAELAKKNVADILGPTFLTDLAIRHQRILHGYDPSKVPSVGDPTVTTADDTHGGVT